MHQSRSSPSRFRWAGLLWFLPAAVVLLLFGTWFQMPWWLVGGWVAIPVLMGVVVGALSGRRKDSADEAYGITSQGARSEGRLSVDSSVEQVMEAVMQTATKLPRFAVAELSHSGARLTAPMNIKTWGQRITLRFRSRVAS